MNTRIMSGLIFILMVMNIAGCGFGGFSDSGSNGPAPGQPGSDTSTKIGGVASKGVFTSGTIRVYAVNTDGSETQLCETSITALTSSVGFKNYSSSISSQKTSTNGSYNGVVMIKASGAYIDEATGNEATIDDTHPLRALIANPTGDVRVAITPLTELAVRKALSVQTAQRQLTAADVQKANALVSEMFKVDIIGTQPVMADGNRSNGFGNVAVTQDQRDYTLALAAISQMAKETGGVTNVLNRLAGDIADGTMSAESATNFQSALTAFITSQLNQTGVTSSNSTNLANVGGMTKKVRLVATEKADHNITITGIIVTVLLPPGVTLKADFRNITDQVKPLLPKVVTPSWTSNDTLLDTVYIPATGSLPGSVMVGLIKGFGFSAGEFGTIQYEVPPGVSVTASDFKIYKNTDNPKDPKNFNATDLNKAKIPDTDLSVSVEEQLPE